nr:EAL domain-containing protein [Sphingomonas sp. CFBP 8764]
MIAALLAGSRLLPNLHYEFLPKIDLTTDQVAGYEALARLRNIPGVNPEWLFAAMTDAGIEAAATMKAVTAALDLWLALSVEQRSAPVAINCSQAVLADPLFQAALGDELRRRGVASNGPGRGVLIIEITEDARPVDTQRLVRDMNGLRDLGVVFSLDDFGKGATNFDRVFTLPIAELKIDKDFFGHCARHVHELGILREVVRSCHARGLSTVVEGVETEEHLAIARDLGARCAQGFYWGRPMAAGSFAHVRVI